MRWSVSAPVRRLTHRLTSHPHELRSVLATVRRIEDGQVRGRLDARATALHRLVTGHPTMSVGQEPNRNYDSGPNQVLFWVLKTARLAASRFLALIPEEAPQRLHAAEVATELETVARSAHVRSVSAGIASSRTPGFAAVAEAARSRLPLYVAAAKAYTSLRRAEEGDADALREVIQDTLLGPTEAWRRFELAVALAASDALGKALGVVPSLGLLAGGDRVVARIGRFAVHWQSLTSAHARPNLEVSEAATQRVLAAYGFRSSWDRPDVVVLDEVSCQVVAVLEAKYFAIGERDGSDALRDATAQLVRYARGYRKPDNLDELLGTSVIALVSRGRFDPLDPQPSGVPWLFDFQDLTQQRLAAWAAHLVSHRDLLAGPSHARLSTMDQAAFFPHQLVEAPFPHQLEDGTAGLASK